MPRVLIGLVLIGRVLIGLVLTISIATPVLADASLTAAVAGAYLPRAEDATLHSIAHERVVEISACPTCFTHDLMRPGMAEVLAMNIGVDDPIGHVIATWGASPVHNGILSDAGWTRIGCAERAIGSTHWFVCVLADGAVSAIAPRVTVLPDTAMR